MNKRTVALLTFAALVADVTSFRPQQSVAFVVRGGAEGDDGPNNETEKDDVVCVGGVCEIRGGSSDPVDEYDDYDEELDEDEELVLGEAEFADEEEDDEEEYVMMEAEDIEEETTTSEVEAEDVDAAVESDEQVELPETEVASEEEEALVEEEEEEEVEVELTADFLAEEDEQVDSTEDEQVDSAEVEVAVSEEAQGTWEENTDAPPSPYEGDTVVHHATDDGDSSAFVDREELADAYDDDETMVDATTAFRAGHTEEDDRASIDDIPAVEEPAANVQEAEEAEAAPVAEEATIEVLNEVVENAAAASPAAVTKEVEKILLQECGFKRSEIRGLKPQIANVMADKRLRRPIEGIPSSWYEAKKKGALLASLGKVLTAVVPVALGALAVYGGLDVKHLFSGMLEDANSLIASAKGPKKVQKIRSEPKSQTIEAVPAEDIVEEDLVEEEPEVAQSQDSDDGKLWLDRKIDAFGDRLNELLGK